MITTPPKIRGFYEFDRYRFYAGERRLVQDGSKQLWLDPKKSALLQALVRKSQELISYAELKTQVPELERLADRTLHQHKYALAAILGKNSEGKEYIENISGKGYRFTMPVSARVENEPEDDRVQEPYTVGDEEKPIHRSELSECSHQSRHATGGSASRFTKIFGGHLAHVIASCLLYALLYAIALLIEIAYQYDHFAHSAWVVAGGIFFYILGTSIVGLWLDWLLTVRGKNTGLLLSLLIFTVSGLFLYIVLCFYLPNEPITEARFPAYPAQGAYLKSVYYFLPLAAVFLILPFHFVISVQRELTRGNRLVENLLLDKRRSVAPAGSIFLRPWMLGPLLLCAAVYGLLATAHLFDHLIANRYTGLFMQLVQLRLLFYFALGLECLLWYSWLVNEIKQGILQKHYC